MKQNIMELAKEEAISYIKGINTANTFKSITERYIRLHNKGIFVDFTFNSSNAEGLFGSFSRLYGFSLDTYIQPKFSRVKRVLYFSDLEKKQKQKVDELDKKIEQLRKVESNFRTSSRELFQDKKLSLPENLTSDFIIKAASDNNIYQFVAGMFQERRNMLTSSLKAKRKGLEYIKKSDRNSRYVEIELKDAELMFFKLILNIYFNSVEKYAASLFNKHKVSVIYSEKEWVGYYLDNRKNRANYYSDIDGLSNFEAFIIDTIDNRQDGFKLKIFNNDYVFSVSKSRASTDLKVKPKETVEDELKALYEQFSVFKNQFPEFILGIQVINGLIQNIGPDDPIVINTASFLKFHYSNEVVNEYETLVKEIRECEQKKYTYEPEPNLPNFYQVFSNLTFDIEKKKNMGYWIGLREEKYDDLLSSISNDELILPFQKLQVEEDKECETI